MRQRWIGPGLMILGVLLLSLGVCLRSTPTKRVDAWAEAVALEKPTTAASVMSPVPADWNAQFDKIHWYPVTGYRIAKPLVPNPHGDGWITTVVWDWDTDAINFPHICIMDLVVNDEGIVVPENAVRVCLPTGELPPPIP